MSWQVIYYKTPRGNCPVVDFISQLPEKDKAKVRRVIDLLVYFGPTLKMPHSRSIHSEYGLYELRSQVGNNIQRILYYGYDKNTFVLLHGFTKKTQKTPSAEIDTAKARLKELLNRKDTK